MRNGGIHGNAQKVQSKKKKGVTHHPVHGRCSALQRNSPSPNPAHSRDSPIWCQQGAEPCLGQSQDHFKPRVQRCTEPSRDGATTPSRHSFFLPATFHSPLRRHQGLHFSNATSKQQLSQLQAVPQSPQPSWKRAQIWPGAKQHQELGIAAASRW